MNPIQKSPTHHSMANLDTFTLYSPTVNRRDLPHFMDTYKELRAKNLDFAFGVKTDFSFDHGKMVRDMTFKNPVVWSLFSEEDICGLPSDEPHFTLALLDRGNDTHDKCDKSNKCDKRDKGVACLVAKWVPKNEFCDARLFVSSINSPLEHIKLLFEVLERMIEHLWRSYDPREYFLSLKLEDYVELFVFAGIVSEECIAAMQLCDFHYDVERGMVLKGLGF